MNNDRDQSDRLADWAESDQPAIDPVTATSGPASRQATRDLVRRASGRPRLDGAEASGIPAPRRQVRLPRDLSDRVDRLARQENRSPSDLMRTAISEYLARHEEDRAEQALPQS